jgi:hypothetical protein
MGFFLFQTNNPLSNQADSILLPGKDSKAGSTSAVGEQKDDTSKDMLADKQLNPASALNQDPASGENQPGSPNGAEQGAKAPFANPSTEPTTNGSLSTGKQTPMGEARPKETAPASSAASTSAPSSAPTSNSMATEGPQATNSPETSAPSPSVEESTPAAESSPAPEKKERNNSGNNLMSIAQMPEETLLSGDGKYLASIEQYHVTIKDNSTQEIIFASNRYWTDADKVTLLEWSTDVKLRYRVSNDTSTQNFEIDAGKKSETLLK